jgi:hypothetical protein
MSLVTTFHRPLEMLVGVASWPLRMGLYVAQPPPLAGNRAAALTLNHKSGPRRSDTRHLPAQTGITSRGETPGNYGVGSLGRC